MRSSSLVRALAALCLALPLAAQDTLSRGVRIGLSYDPGTRPGVMVLPVSGAAGDSIRAILQRDLANGDRVNAMGADAGAVRVGSPNWALLARLGAAAAVQATPTPSGLHVAVYDVAKQRTALVKDYPAPSSSDARAWRAAVHAVSDDLEESLTGTRGIARTRVLFERGKRIWMVDSDGESAIPVTDTAIPISSAWSPSGGQIVFSTLIPAQIILRDLASGRERVIAGGNGVYISPVFTPDGSSLVYGHGSDDGVDIYTAPVAGGSQRRLSVGRGSDNVSPSFSPDGRRIAFMSGRAGHPEIYSMDADGTNVDLLTPLEFGEQAFRASPDWSPDGRLVAFHNQIAGSYQVVTINLRDRSLRQLTSDGRNEDPSWAPDGRHLVFTSNRTGSRQLWVLDTESGRSRQLTHGAPARLSAWSPRLPN
ncbi:MAG: PD40 domain-containing protein [Gemmatimonadaceae bacterium]|nr:PD40 domain-containing protein [Gemmatimonadaceae bacterium]